MQLGQASPELGEKAHDVSKTLAAGADASKERDNSGASSLSPSGYKDTPIFIEACAGCGILSSMVQRKGFPDHPNRLPAESPHS